LAQVKLLSGSTKPYRCMSFRGHAEDVFIPVATSQAATVWRKYAINTETGAGTKLSWPTLPHVSRGLQYVPPAPILHVGSGSVSPVTTCPLVLSAVCGSLAFVGASHVAGTRTGWRSGTERRATTSRKSGTMSPALTNFVAGLLAGVASDVPLHPIDTIKTRLQAQDGFKKSGGFRGLWAGVSTVVLRSAPCSAIFFVGYEQVRRGIELQVPAARGTALCDATAGAAANLFACVVRTPCEVLKQRMQAPENGRLAKEPSMSQHMRSILHEGTRGCFAGLSGLLSREMAFAVIQMPVFEFLKHEMQKGDQCRSRGTVGAVAGGAAGALAGALTTPLDAAKTRMMLASHQTRQHSLSTILQLLHAEAGVGGLFRGVIPRTLYIGVSSALWLGAFEWSKEVLGGSGSMKA